MSDPLFAIIARDAANSDALRVEHRDGHLAHFKAHADKIAVAGPLSGPSTGSLIIYRAASAQEARQFITGDPFHAHGVWESLEILNFKAGSGSRAV